MSKESSISADERKRMEMMMKQSTQEYQPNEYLVKPHIVPSIGCYQHYCTRCRDYGHVRNNCPFVLRPPAATTAAPSQLQETPSDSSLENTLKKELSESETSVPELLETIEALEPFPSHSTRPTSIKLKLRNLPEKGKDNSRTSTISTLEDQQKSVDERQTVQDTAISNVTQVRSNTIPTAEVVQQPAAAIAFANTSQPTRNAMAGVDNSNIQQLEEMNASTATYSGHLSAANPAAAIFPPQPHYSSWGQPPVQVNMNVMTFPYTHPQGYYTPYTHPQGCYTPYTHPQGCYTPYTHPQGCYTPQVELPRYQLPHSGSGYSLAASHGVYNNPPYLPQAGYWTPTYSNERQDHMNYAAAQRHPERYQPYERDRWSRGMLSRRSDDPNFRGEPSAGERRHYQEHGRHDDRHRRQHNEEHRRYGEEGRRHSRERSHHDDRYQRHSEDKRHADDEYQSRYGEDDSDTRNVQHEDRSSQESWSPISDEEN